jgi:general secretion pathway protein C
VEQSPIAGQDMITKAIWMDFSSASGGNALATINRVIPPWVSLLLVVLIGWQLARIAWMLVPGPAAGDPVAVPVAAPSGASGSSMAADVQTIAAAHMFGIADEAAPVELAPQPSEDENLADTGLTNLVLKGTIASEIPEFSVAVIADGNADQKVYLIGDAIGSRASLHAVYADRVVLNEKGALTNLRLPSEFPATRAAPTRRATSTTRQASQRNTASIQNVVTENLTKLTDVIRPTPYLVNGQQAGYRVYPGRNRQQFAALGLRPGDLIMDIDGQALTDPTQAMQIFQSLGTAEQVTVTVERNGEQQSIVLKTSQLDLTDEQTQ